MEINILASGSSGNCYIIDDGKTNLMIECGIPIQEIKIKTNIFERLPDGCIVSHSHKDHSLSCRYLQEMGINIYMSEQCKCELQTDNDYRISIISHDKNFTVGTFVIKPLKMHHDVYCLGFLIYSKVTNEQLFFATDTYYIQYKIPPCDYIMVEANYDIELMNERIRNGDTAMAAKDRLMKSHLEINTTIKWLECQNLRKTKRIYLLHLSDGSSNEKEFKRKVMEVTGIPVTIC